MGEILQGYYPQGNTIPFLGIACYVDFMLYFYKNFGAMIFSGGAGWVVSELGRY